MTKKYSELDFIQAVKSSFSIREVLIKLGLKPAGGNYSSFNEKVKRLGLDTSHFKGQGWNKGRLGSTNRRDDLSDFLTNKKSIQSYKLRNYLIRDGLLEYKCRECGLSDWLDKPISLELDHIDGNPKNNLLTNLRLLCPNCHSQTDTFRNKKRP